MKIFIFRLGHRISRDHRISSHCGLVARAFGADGIVYSGEKDQSLLDSVRNVSKQWGGKFEVSYEKDWRRFIKNWKGRMVHLTVYGMPVQEKIGEIEKSKEDLLVVIGGEKVPPEVYKLADWNISVTSQPHSEIAALSIFLDRLWKGGELYKIFLKARKRILPQERGKKVVRK
ncbi:MAG: tRNA (cytidine(56)-2'-O)-methyltransferase [Candidatus Aenigmarchaeota archaeon]|nr:tRNA (cytidine(56)-2'-O)-methyltransferase [Candidatus Aenigmarchaeota archaeon]NIP40299.1 tRNA (cytidine(56)-2'-O)-methyltransferase [Candidatus Aenigmarchaeota archaeon]NIQ17791.1 tRNA (cytidine(56)-2'-O)-methyltransferase [Candidatus Aenigmarchaeota archaeon]NIS73174.1 tRNA (cytidine(56)-2'-O)-methyltransferase [Candidatus Aenigmarchaeota archaeon]